MLIEPAQTRLLLDVARDAIRAALGAGAADTRRLQEAAALNLPRCGCFVSLHEQVTHRLRGCIGRMIGDQPLAQTVADMARAVLEDPRFLAQLVTAEELPRLEIELTVLSPLQRAAGPLDFDPQTHGIYLTFGGESGCFLPQVARETGWGRERLLERLCTEKMGLPPDAWRDPAAELRTFTAQILGPEAF